MIPDAEWKALIGQKGELVPGPYPVSIAAIGYLAEALEDERLADHIASGSAIVAPRSFVTIASRIPNWRRRNASGPSTFMQSWLLPLPANLAVITVFDQRYFAPLIPGDRVSTQSTITDIVPRRTRLGDGYFVTDEIDHWNQNGEIIARTVITMFRFSTKGYGSDSSPNAPPNPGHVASISKTHALQTSDFLPINMPITMTKLVTAAGAVRDFSPIHHDVDIARKSGHPTAFVSFSFQMALIGRALGEWFGGDDCVRRIRLALKSSIYLGETVVCTGIRQDTASAVDKGIDTVELTLETDDGICTSGIAEIQSCGTH
jgi:acyl dehydratase